MTKEQKEKALAFLKDMQECTYDGVEEIRTAIECLEQPTSDDCMDRNHVIATISHHHFDKDKDNFDLLVHNLCKEVKALPPVIPTQRWIPCSERLPEDRNLVLVTAYWHETYQVMMASYFGDGLWWCVPFNNCGDHMQKLNPKAWMPLPKPCQGKQNNKVGWSSLENVREKVERGNSNDMG